MIYLKLFSKRVIKDEEAIELISELDSDEEIINYLKSQNFNLKEIMEAFERHYGIKYVELCEIDLSKDIFSHFNIERLREHLILPYKYENGVYYFATNNIIRKDNSIIVNNNTDVKNIKKIFKFAFDHEIEMAYERVLDGRVDCKDSPVYSKTIEDEGEFIVVDWVNKLLEKGINYAASDIHVETKSGGLQIRYRIDGILSRKEFYKLSKSEISNIIVRLKLISGMDISERRKPQDGRIGNYLLDGEDYDFRVSCINTNSGEKIVLRIFNRSKKIPSFEELGFLKEDVLKINKALKRKNGVIYIAGATGSGKTTTLYSMIDKLNSDRVNIYTIEDPIEKEIENINQIQIDVPAGITFPSTLKSLLRQDPDIIVVGEVRDVETADLSISASLTGHLVVSTMHANSAIDSISRLFEMGIEPFLLGTSSLLFISQSLVRCLCPRCKKRTGKIKGIDRLWLKKRYRLSDLEIDDLTKKHTIYEAVGCKHCLGGYKGRTAIGEFFEVSRRIREEISKKSSIKTIEDVAYREGYRGIETSAIKNVLNGKISIEEIIKTIG